ncbi:uncharacterized protein CTRU02_214237 [Colletotrichum truncatum]|uniref:Uncharacterized protein n=1 Tax=Colletotrichum truncatum TaxID=5467 RepID=A0ACC3YJW9_COLTU
MAEKDKKRSPTEARLATSSYSSLSRAGPSLAVVEDEPPSYGISADNDLIPPTTLLLAGATIYGSGSASSPPLYELSYPIGHLRESNTTVSFERVEHRIRTASGTQQVPRVSTRKKHIFDLKRALAIQLTAPQFSYYLESLSRNNLGHLGLKTHRHWFGTVAGYRAYRASRPRPYADLEPGDIAFVVKERGKGKFEWRNGGPDGEHRIVAYEESEGGIYQLRVCEALTQKERDALVATWCLRLWWEIAVANHEPLTWAEGKLEGLTLPWGVLLTLKLKLNTP